MRRNPKELLLFGLISVPVFYAIFQIAMLNENVVTKFNPVTTYRQKYPNLTKATACYYEPSVDGAFENLHPDDPTRKSEEPIPGRSIFFLETSCSGDEGLVISARQACAVESAALMNPSKTVYLLVLSPAKLANRSKLIVEQLKSYDNVKIRRILVEEYVKNTPLEDWNMPEKVDRSKWPRVHMADMLRLLILRKYQGMYFDLDFVIMTALDDLTHRSFVFLETDTIATNSVLGFADNNSSRKLLDNCLRTVTLTYNPKAWSAIGPYLVTRLVRITCNVTTPKLMMKDMESRCHGLTVFPRPVFAPIHYDNWRGFFKVDKSGEFMKLLKNARAMHLWNTFSRNSTIKVGSQAPYALIASKYCPKVYSNCGTTF